MAAGSSPPLLVQSLRAMADQGIAAVHGESAVAAALAAPPAVDLVAAARRVFGVAVGKAAPEMHRGLVERTAAWGGGIVVSHTQGSVPGGAVHLSGDHPIPGPASAAAGRAVLEFLDSAGLESRDLVVVCVSGGTSALIAVPIPGVGVADLAAVGAALLGSGAGIAEINAARRMLSRTHNGGLAAAAAPARVLGLLMNDTPGAPLSAIGSGPTFPAEDTSADAMRLVAADVAEPVRTRVLAALGEARGFPAASPAVTNVEVAGPQRALAACASAAHDLGLACEVLDDPETGDVRAAAARLAGRLRLLSGRGAAARCLIAAGEVSVRVAGGGRGGRCQQLAWEMIPHLAGIPGSAFVAAATDGRDHLPGIGGAWATDASAASVTDAGLAWDRVAADNDTQAGLATLGQLLPERDTGTNVADLYLAAVGSSS